MTRVYVVALTWALTTSALTTTQAWAQPDAPAPEAEGETTDSEVEGEAEARPAPIEEPNPGLEEARERIARADSLYSAENYDSALAEFERALALLEGHEMRFLVLFNIGRCQEKLFRYSEAMASFRAFLEQGGAETQYAPQVTAKIELLEGLLGTVRVSVNIQGYELWVDDRLIGADVTELLLPGGSHAVEVRAEGYVQAQQQVAVVARDEASLTFEMERLAEEFEGLSPGLFWTGVGVTVLAVVGGAIFGAQALSKSNDVDGRDPSIATRGEIDDIQSSARNADILFGVAALAATTTVIFALFTDWGGDDSEDEAEQSASVRVQPVAGPRGAGLSLQGQF